MKQDILNYLFTDRTWEAGKAIYSRHPMRSKSMSAAFNRMDGTQSDIKQLHYELAKLESIPEGMLNNIINSPLKAAQEQPKATAKAQDAPPSEEQVQKEAHQLHSLFREFPFLLEEGCPPQLKRLVTRKVDDYYKFKELHPQLFEVAQGADASQLAEGIVEAYVNNQLAFEELAHYKATGTVLGKHPQFAVWDEEEAIRAMETKDLVKKRNALTKSINDFKANLAKGDKPHLEESRREALATKEHLLALVDQQIEAR